MAEPVIQLVRAYSGPVLVAVQTLPEEQARRYVDELKANEVVSHIQLLFRSAVGEEMTLPNGKKLQAEEWSATTYVRTGDRWPTITARLGQ